LQGIKTTGMAYGEQQFLLGKQTWRVFTINEQQFFVSHNSGSQYEDITRSKVDAGPYLSRVVSTATNDLPTNAIQTISNDLTSPLGLLATTHVQITAAADKLPAGWWWQRLLNEGQLAWEYRLVNGNVPNANLMHAPLSELDASEVTPLYLSSQALTLVMIRWLGENSQVQTQLSLPSSFTQQNAGLRRLRPTQVVKVNLTGTIAQRSATGAILGTQYVNFTNSNTFYVLSHSIKTDGTSVASTQTVVGTMLGKSTPQDLVHSMILRIKALSTFGVRHRARR